VQTDATASRGDAIYQYLVPIVAVLTAAVLLGERPTSPQIVGAGLVFAGLYTARRSAANCPS